MSRMVDENREWYAVQVKPHRERKAVRHLASKGVPTFLPLIETSHRLGRGASWLEPLFSGYVFVRLQCAGLSPHLWDAVRWSPGVRRILSAECGTGSVPAEAMVELRARVREFGFVRRRARFTPGERVRVRSGPLAGWDAIFDGPVSRPGRVRVLLALLGQSGRAEIDEAMLDAA